ncbi:MAG: tetratricopeptide repeat protein [Lentisphaerae bacterium]|nr:tetratricopeptide repeat protein [Lentisphaerota bacterium]
MEHGLKTVRLTGRGIVAWLVLAGCTAMAQQDAPVNPELAEGLRYVRGLQDLRLPDMADLVITDLEARFPDARAHVARLKLEGDLARGLFDKVVAVIKAEKDQNSVETWAMKLALADAYYAYGKYPEAKQHYEAFFAAFAKDTPAALQTFYNESAYKYAQMLLYLKDLKGALAAYERVLQGKLEKHVERQCMAEMADVGLRLAKETEAVKAREEIYKKVEAVADKLLWVQDIWFGKAIVLKAHVAMLRGKPDVAKKLVDDYMATLQAIHQALVEQEAETGEPLTRVSPMSECRYLLAAMLQEESRRLMEQPGYDRDAVLSMLIGTKGADGKRKGDGAYQHFINVFLKYPESAWAAEAGERAEQIRLVIAEVFGGTITASVTPEQTAKVRAIQYRDARLLFAQGQIENAKARLLRVLNQFPDASESVGALGDLARCYMQTIIDNPDDELYADLVIGHLAERFSQRPETRGLAGDEIVRLAEFWLEGGRADKRAHVYDLFFINFPTHAMASSYMLSFGERRYQEKDYPAALSYFRQVEQAYSNSPAAFAAMNRIASIYEEMNDVTNQIAAIEAYVGALAGRDRPGQELMNARYRQAQAYKTYGTELLKDATNETAVVAGNQWIGRAAVAYSQLADVLKDPANPYQANDAEKKANASLREAALYNMAYCLSQVNRPAANVPAIRQRAIAAYENLVNSFPKSPLAPTALIQVGSLWTIMRDAAKAEATLSRLLKDYPDANEARSALPMIADNLMKLGMREEAVPRYRQMFAETGGKYSDLDLLRAAQVLTTAKEYDLAQQGLDRVLARAREPAILAPARLAQGNLLLARGQYTAAVEALKAFIEDFAGYALMVDANELLCRAASEAGMREEDDLKRKLLFNDAVDAIKQVQQRRTNQIEVAQSDIEVGRLMARKARAEVAFNKPAAAEDSRGRAIISYQAFIDSTDPSNLALAPLVETAYFESVPLLLEHKRWRFAAENCEAYLNSFPRGRYITQMRTWLNQAHIEMGTSAQPAPGAATTASPPAEPPAAEPAPVESAPAAGS